MDDIPFMARVAALLALALGMVWYDRSRHKGSPSRLWEYAFLFVVGAIGAIYGAINDAITSGLSPAYFIIGKGVDENASVRVQAIILGAEVGFSAGVISCAIWQFVLRRIPARQRCLAILRYVWLPFVLAALLAVLFPVALDRTDPFDFTSLLQSILPEEELARFITVWWAHIGAYAGLLIGLVVGIFLTRKSTNAGVR